MNITITLILSAMEHISSSWELRVNISLNLSDMEHISCSWKLSQGAVCMVVTLSETPPD